MDRWSGLLRYDTIRDVEYDGWRLPTNLVDDLPFHHGWWVSGVGIDPTPTIGPHTELSYMYYVNLELNGYHNNNGSWGANFGVNGDSTFGGENDIGLVENLQGGEYWLGFNMADVSNHYDTQPFTFNTNAGNHHVRLSDSHFAWAVHDGDVSAVPAPPALLLFGTGLLELIGIKSRRKVA